MGCNVYSRSQSGNIICERAHNTCLCFDLFPSMCQLDKDKKLKMSGDQTASTSESCDLKTIETLFGQIAIGPAGSGKTTYIAAAAEFLAKLDREVIIVNLDPANDTLPYNASIDINELVRLEEVMQVENLGPNGALFFCFDLLEKNYEWLESRIEEEFYKAKAKIENEPRENSNESPRKRPYILFDSPGQIELFTNYPKYKQIIYRLINFNKVNIADNFSCFYISFLLPNYRKKRNLPPNLWNFAWGP